MGVSDEVSCGFCDARVGATCLPKLAEIDANGEADPTSDRRCPHCRSSLVMSDSNARRLAMRESRPSVSETTAGDLVTLEDLLMQLIHIQVAAAELYTMEVHRAARLAANNKRFASMLDRVLGS